jgi:hypothetical protein
MKKITKKKIKTFSKYLVNGLNMINLLLLGLARVWEWDIDKISATIIVVAGVISTYLTQGKLFDKNIEDIEVRG